MRPVCVAACAYLLQRLGLGFLRLRVSCRRAKAAVAGSVAVLECVKDVEPEPAVEGLEEQHAAQSKLRRERRQLLLDDVVERASLVAIRDEREALPGRVTQLHLRRPDALG